MSQRKKKSRLHACVFLVSVIIVSSVQYISFLCAPFHSSSQTTVKQILTNLLINSKTTVQRPHVKSPQNRFTTPSVLCEEATAFNRIAPYARITVSIFLAKTSTAQGLLHRRSSSKVLSILIQSIFIPPTAKINCTLPGMPG